MKITADEVKAVLLEAYPTEQPTDLPEFQEQRERAWEDIVRAFGEEIQGDGEAFLGGLLYDAHHRLTTERWVRLQRTAQ